MIQSREIREKARTSGVPESTIERDYVQNWLLSSMYALKMNVVLKGGTGIRKAYIPDYRFSDDLDFTLLQDTDKEVFEGLVAEAVKTSKEETGVDFDEKVVIDENVNGYECIVYFRLLRQTGSPTRIKLDVTRHNKEKMVLAPEKKKIIHPYSDDCTSVIVVYHLEELMAEKLRAIFERTRPRDLYDLWYIKDRLNDETVKILSEKCRFKNVEPDLGSFIERMEAFSSAWQNSLGHQLKILPDFDRTYADVLKMLKGLVDSNR